MDTPDWRSVVADYGPAAVVVVALVFMWVVRTIPVDQVISESAVFFSGNDPWYHSRIVQLTVANFPTTPGFDPWSYFPYGTGRHSGFGGLFDQLIALAALIIGVGSPTPRLIDIVTAYAPAAFGAATVVPLYFVARRVMGRVGGVLSVTLLALVGGQFLSRTVIGSADHQAAEPLFGTLAVLGFIHIVRVSLREKPTVADLQDRNWQVLRRPISHAALGGIAIAAYLMTWPPGVIFVFTFGLFVVLQMIREHLAGRPLDYLGIGIATGLGVTGLLTLGYAKTYIFGPNAFSLLQPTVAFGVGIGSLVLMGISEYMTREGYERRYYPVVIVGLIAGVLTISAIVFPRTVELLNGLITRVYSFGVLTSPSALTVAEIRPATLNDAWRAFGALFYIAIIGALLMVARVVDENRPLELLVVLWTFTITSAYFTSIRFGYYVAVNVALLAAFGVWWVSVKLLNITPEIDEVADIETYQIIGILLILVAIVPGNVVAVQGTAPPVWEQTEASGITGTDQAWYGELAWMRNNTPEEPLDYTEIYEAPANRDFEYPESAYGVMSWWDYGHWITVTAHRIPIANPFQQGPRAASAYLQAQNETRANLILEALPSIRDQAKDIGNISNAELQRIVAEQSEQHAGEDTRYVIIDDQMVGGKFGAIATWTGPGYSAYLSRQEFQLGRNQTATLMGVNDRYERMIMSRLYFQDASGLSHYRLVHESSSRSTFASVAQSTGPNTFQATNFINRRVSPRVLQAVRSRSDLTFYDIKTESRVKVFERVEGARVVGSVNTSNRTRVFAILQLQTNTGRNFTYVQQTRTDPSGEFNLTLAYPTADGVTPAEGGTDSGVVALGNYSIVAGNPFLPSGRATLDVPEAAVLEGRTINVELTRPEQPNVNVSTGNSTQLPLLSDDPLADREGRSNAPQSGKPSNDRTAPAAGGRVAGAIEP